MKKGEIYVGKIRELVFPNKGIADAEGCDVVVKNTLPGQEVSFLLSKNKPGLKEGRLVEVLQRAGNEVMPDCPHCAGSEDDGIMRHPVCGGCSFRTLPYEEELKLKERMALDVIGRALKQHAADAEADAGADAGTGTASDAGEYAAGVLSEVYEGITGSPDSDGYRNKMEFSFGNEVKDGPLTLGMHVSGHFMDVTDTPECRIVDEDMRKIRSAIKEYALSKGMSFYHRYSNTGFLRNLLVRKGRKTGEILVDVVTTSESELGESELCKVMLELDLEGRITGILHTVNDAAGDAVNNESTKILYGRDHIYDEVLGLRFRISVFSFFQTNTLGAEVLYERVREYVRDAVKKGGDTGAGVVYDLYSGTGTITQLVADAASEVYGIEIVEEAVEAARENAKLNGTDNVHFLCGDVFRTLDEVEEMPDLIILDPPREGVQPKALKRILGYGVEHIIYISCKISSLARDLHEFYDAGYSLQRMSVIDMFPRTANMETVCLLSKLSEAKHHIEVKVDMDELDLTSAEAKATYREIEESILKKISKR